MISTRTAISAARTIVYAGLGWWAAAQPEGPRGLFDDALLGGVFADYVTWLLAVVTGFPGGIAHGFYEAVINLAFGWLVMKDVLVGFEPGDQGLAGATLAFMLVVGLKGLYYAIKFYSNELESGNLGPTPPLVPVFASDVLDGEIDATGAPSESPPVIRYVNGFLLGMIGRGETAASLSGSGPAPEIDLVDGSRLAADGEHVVNRLKVMSGLNPGPSAQPVEGGFNFRCPDRTYHVHTRFDGTTAEVKIVG